MYFWAGSVRNEDQTEGFPVVATVVVTIMGRRRLHRKMKRENEAEVSETAVLALVWMVLLLTLSFSLLLLLEEESEDQIEQISSPRLEERTWRSRQHVPQTAHRRLNQ